MKESDNIKESLQSIFQDFEVSPAENAWERIEMTLEQNRKIVVLRRRYISVAVAAIALLLAGSLLLLQTPQDINNNMAQTSKEFFDEGNDGIEKEYIENSTKNDRNSQYVQQKLFAGISKKSNNYRKNQQPSSSYIQSENILDEFINKKDTHATNVQEKYSAKNETEQKQITPTEAERRMQEFVAMAEKGLILDELTKNSDKPVLLALSARGALTPFQKTVNTPMTLRNIQYNRPNYMANSVPGSPVQPLKNIAEMEHLLPLSFGLTFSKNIIDRLSIETGLVYTYLFSKAKNRNDLYNNVETQHFHYFGIPLQLNYDVFNLNKMNIYVSLGGMVEKDFRGEFRSIENNNESGDANYYVTTKIEQKRPQYSMNVGLGVSYPIIDKFNLYGKIGGSYYFNANNYYKTIYSDKKTVLDISFGVRYNIDINN